MELNRDTPVTDFPGIGPARAKRLEKLGLRTAGALLTFYPRAYEDRTARYEIAHAPLGVRVCICALVAARPQHAYVRRGMELIKLTVVDGSGALHITFFNQTYVKNALVPGQEYIFYGAVEEQNRRRTMLNPIFEPVGREQDTGRIMPVYPLTAGISNHLLASLTRRSLPCAAELSDPLPDSVRAAYALAPLTFSLENIHFPASFDDLERAKHRLIFEELFFLSIGLELLRSRRGHQPGMAVAPRPAEEFFALLPFAPTGAQRRVMEQIAHDLASGRPMNRLVQGDVGSGKTAVAAFAAWLVTKQGLQAAMMAPTEVLAEQHFRSLSALLAPAGVRVGLLSGSMPAAQKRDVRAQLAAGEIDLVVGTHALISKDVAFSRLALVITDEQHRFGVDQRARLSEKVEGGGQTAAHVLVMSATPIPRTLALIIYGDLEVSVIDELPPGRTPVHTYIVGEDKRARFYGFVRKLVAEGRQVYIVCPAVEENPEGTDGAPTMNLKAVTAYAETLRGEVFPDLRVDLLHGRMRPREKEAVMAAFSAGETDILVATTVIEVGVDVPNAALMIVENAERFGLSQLHQLRGRVGRGAHESHCVLVTSSRRPETLARLRVLAATNDGFEISEEDLKLRGPGDFFGNRQHGLPQLSIADLAGDMRVLSLAQQAARGCVEDDPALQKPENAPLLARVRSLFADTPGIFN